MIRDRQVAEKLHIINTTIAVYKALGGDWQVASEIQSVELASANSRSYTRLFKPMLSIKNTADSISGIFVII
ncbi:hypothetical protein ITG08_13330 [Vibrio cyclitrophicus]|nr:hypothetical protein ITG08_13330 [Vibrio cyclitrophicus]